MRFAIILVFGFVMAHMWKVDRRIDDLDLTRETFRVAPTFFSPENAISTVLGDAGKQ